MSWLFEFFVAKIKFQNHLKFCSKMLDVIYKKLGKF